MVSNSSEVSRHDLEVSLTYYQPPLASMSESGSKGPAPPPPPLPSTEPPPAGAAVSNVGGVDVDDAALEGAVAELSVDAAPELAAVGAPAKHLRGVAKGGAKQRALSGASKMPGLPASMGGASAAEGRSTEGNVALQTEEGLTEAEEGLAVFRGTADVEDGDVVAIYQVEKGMYWTCEEQTIGGGFAIKLRPRGRQLCEGNKFSVVIAPDDTDHLGNEKGVRFALRSHYNNKLVAPNFRGRCVVAPTAHPAPPPPKHPTNTRALTHNIDFAHSPAPPQLPR